VQQVPEQPAGEGAVALLGPGAQRAGQLQPVGDNARQFLRGGGHQPDPFAGVQVLLGQRPGAGVDPGGDDLVVDVLRHRHDLGYRLAGDEGQC
jgi:hypothetical protein